eukprot:1457130-Pyramimonas_sp.AAC.1
MAPPQKHRSPGAQEPQCDDTLDGATECRRRLCSGMGFPYPPLDSSCIAPPMAVKRVSEN